jgi:hypothetical protein
MQLRRVRLTVGADVVQVKRVEGVGHARLVQANANALFLRASSDLRVAQPATDANGALWAAAYDGHAIDAIVATAGARGVRVSRISPEPHLVPESLRQQRRFATREPLAWYPSRRWKPSRRARAAIVALLVACFATSTAVALSAAGVRQTWFVRDHATQVAATRASVAAAARVRAELSRVSRQLSDVAAFGDARQAVASLAAEISDALPESSAVVTLRIDPNEGSLTAVTANAANLLEGLTHVHGIAAVRVNGALTAEMIGGTRFQRVTVRFRRGTVRK